MAEKTPTMYLIAGPNGAGKSTLYHTVIKPIVKAPFINADVIQKDDLQNADPTASYEAAQIATRKREEHLRDKKSFVTETVFSHGSKLELMEQAKKAGFQTVLYHVNVRSPNLSVARVAARVKEGGHDVPDDKIRERYDRNQPLIRAATKKADKAFIYDNSSLNRAPKLQIEMTRGRVVNIADKVVGWARDLYAQELSPYSPARQNAAAASYSDLKKIAKAQSGEDVQLKIPEAKKTYRGPIVGESSKHVLQRTEDGEYLGHFKAVVGEDLKRGQDAEIKYGSRYKATTRVRTLTPEQQDKALQNAVSKIEDPARRAKAQEKLAAIREANRPKQEQAAPTAKPKPAKAKAKAKDRDFGIGD